MRTVSTIVFLSLTIVALVALGNACTSQPPLDPAASANLENPGH